MVFLNLYGLLALLAIPVIVLIHFLQKKSQTLSISTLFLLKKTYVVSEVGRKVDKFISSIPFWLQIVAVLLITWILLKPKVVNKHSTQLVAIVLDSSASMQPSLKRLKESLREEIPKLQGVAQNIHLWVIPGDSSQNKIYSGKSIEEMMSSLENWIPQDGAVDPQKALKLARSFVGEKGRVLYYTDTPIKGISTNVDVHAIGVALDNCGFTNVSFEKQGEQILWKTLVRNYSQTKQSRKWFLIDEKGRRTEEKIITLAPNKLMHLQGLFPEGAERCKIVLSQDDFQSDDSLYLVKPKPKMLTISSASSKNKESLISKIVNSVPNTVISNTVEADLLIEVGNATTSIGSNQHKIVSLTSDAKSKYRQGSPVAVDHPFINNLYWGNLLTKEAAGFSVKEGDQPLLWLKDDPLVFLRNNKKGDKYSLIFNFSLEQSNAYKQESFALLLFRFIENVRFQKVVPSSAVTEAGQVLDIRLPSQEENNPLRLIETTLKGETKKSTLIKRNERLLVPKTPGFYAIEQKGLKYFTGSACFSDVRESDFSECATQHVPATHTVDVTTEYSEDIAFWHVWIVTIIGILLLSWFYSTRRI